MFKKIKELLEDLTFEIKYGLLGKTYSFITSIPRNLKVIKDYIPLLWDSFEFDGGYLEDLIIFKLKRMEKFFNSDHTWCMDAKNYAKEIKYTIECLEINDDWELTDQRRFHEEKYGNLILSSKPHKNNALLTECIITHSKCNTPEMEKEANDESMRIYQLENKIRQENFEMGFDMIKNRLKYWWD